MTIPNNTTYPLLLTDLHLCHGDWTPGGWEPPAVIAPRSEVAWQSESVGIGTGTEAWVKYRMGFRPTVLPGGTPPPPVLGDTVYAYWDNPFLVNPLDDEELTGAKGTVALSDVPVDCDGANAASAGSGFAQDPSRLPKGFVPARPMVANGAQLLLDLPQVPFAPVVIWGTLKV